MATIPAHQRQRYDTAANWTSNNPTLASGEIGIESDTRREKVGDGSTAWTSLAYKGVSGPASSTDNRLVRFDGTDGKKVQGSGITVSDSDEVDGARLRDYTEVGASPSSSSGTLTLDLDTARIFNVTLTENVTVAFSNVPADNTASITIVFTQDATGGRTVAWPASVQWPGGSAPTITSSANAVDVITLFTPDQGTTWYGFAAGQNFS